VERCILPLSSVDPMHFQCAFFYGFGISHLYCSYPADTDKASAADLVTLPTQFISRKMFPCFSYSISENVLSKRSRS
jgi:hypothetical protein